MNHLKSELFEKTFEVRWSDCDANQHMRHSAYADMCAHTRVEFLSSMGMTPGWFQKHKIGPVLFKEETEYKKEVHMGQRLRVTVDSAAPTEFSKSVQLIQYVYTEEGELSAIHRCVVAWMSLEKRKVIELPDQIKRTLPNKVNEPAEEQVA